MMRKKKGICEENQEVEREWRRSERRFKFDEEKEAIKDMENHKHKGKLGEEIGAKEANQVR